MSSQSPISLTYQPSGVTHSAAAAWIPLAKAIASIAIFCGAIGIGLFGYSIVNGSLAHLRATARVQSGLINMATFIRTRVVLGAAESILLFVGGVTILIRRPIGRAFLLAGLGVYFCKIGLELLYYGAGTSHPSVILIERLINGWFAVILYAVFACVVLLRPGLFKNSQEKRI